MKFSSGTVRAHLAHVAPGRRVPPPRLLDWRRDAVGAPCSTSARRFRKFGGQGEIVSGHRYMASRITEHRPGLSWTERVSTAGAAEDQRRKAAFYRLANSVARRSRPCLSLRRRKAELNLGRWFHKDLGFRELPFDRRASITRRKAELRACRRCRGQPRPKSVLWPRRLPLFEFGFTRPFRYPPLCL